MKKKFIMLLLTTIFLVLTVGCEKEKETKENKENIVIEKETNVPTLNATFKQIENKVEIKWETNLKVVEEHYGEEHVKGEGIAHININGKKVAGLRKMEVYTTENLEPGYYHIEISLHKNNHEPYNVKQSFELEIK